MSSRSSDFSLSKNLRWFEFSLWIKATDASITEVARKLGLAPTRLAWFIRHTPDDYVPSEMLVYVRRIMVGDRKKAEHHFMTLVEALHSIDRPKRWVSDQGLCIDVWNRASRGVHGIPTEFSTAIQDAMYELTGRKILVYSLPRYSPTGYPVERESFEKIQDRFWKFYAHKIDKKWE
jgi:hypothetical protein